MPSTVVVTYTLRPEVYAEHVALIEAVFTQLHTQRPDTVDYQVLCLADGVSFVHISSHETPDGANPLTELAAFQDFGREVASRTSTPPAPSPASVLGTYRGLPS